MNKVLNDNQKFYRIRVDAAKALAKVRRSFAVRWLKFRVEFGDRLGSPQQVLSRSLLWCKGFASETKWLQKSNYSHGTEGDTPCGEISRKTHLRQGCVEAIGSIRTSDGHTPDDIVEFLLDLLKNNDNTINQVKAWLTIRSNAWQYMDNYYLASLLTSVSLMRPMNRKFELKIYKQLERHLNVEKLLPSYHNTVTISCLNVRCFPPHLIFKCCREYARCSVRGGHRKILNYSENTRREILFYQIRLHICRWMKNRSF